jgi:hypothetical protein
MQDPIRMSNDISANLKNHNSPAPLRDPFQVLTELHKFRLLRTEPSIELANACASCFRQAEYSRYSITPRLRSASACVLLYRTSADRSRNFCEPSAPSVTAVPLHRSTATLPHRRNVRIVSPPASTNSTLIGIFPSACVEHDRQGSKHRIPASIRLSMPSLISLSGSLM